jgi:hypothetical protein
MIISRGGRVGRPVQSLRVSPAELDRTALLLARTRGHGPRDERLIVAFSRNGEPGACRPGLGPAEAVFTGEGLRRRSRLREMRIVAGVRR